MDEVWEGDFRYYTLTPLAASTGIRIGEVQALQNRDFHQS
jgi:integrase